MLGAAAPGLPVSTLEFGSVAAGANEACLERSPSSAVTEPTSAWWAAARLDRTRRRAPRSPTRVRAGTGATASGAAAARSAQLPRSSRGSAGMSKAALATPPNPSSLPRSSIR